MKKSLITLISVILVIEIVLVVWLVKTRGSNPDAEAAEKDNSTLKKELLDITEQAEALKKENEELRNKTDNIAKILEKKDQQLWSVEKANEKLREIVSSKFTQSQIDATQLDEKRRAEIADLNKKIDALNTRLNDEMKKKDTKIEELEKSIALTEKVLDEERRTTADLGKQLETEKGKVNVLAGQVKSLTAENEKLKKELDAEKGKVNVLVGQVKSLTAENEKLKKELDTEKGKAAGLAAENQTLKKQINESTGEQ